jgi:hypothetical protein
MAYLFMTASEDVHGTWESEGGENALIVQPGRIPSHVTTAPLAQGPTLGTEFEVEFEVTNPGELDDALDSRIGGEPTWLQAESYPPGAWGFLFQLDSCGPLQEINFGDVGVGYGFLSPDEQEGRFLWQCC